MTAIWARFIVGRIYNDAIPLGRPASITIEQPFLKKADEIYFRRIGDMLAGASGEPIPGGRTLPCNALDNLRTIAEHPVARAWGYVVAELDAKRIPTNPVNQGLSEVIAALDRSFD